jgi:hypothetical protein
MAGKVLNIKVFSPLKLHIGLTSKYHAICHYSYNLPLYVTRNRVYRDRVLTKNLKVCLLILNAVFVNTYIFLMLVNPVQIKILN